MKWQHFVQIWYLNPTMKNCQGRFPRGNSEFPGGSPPGYMPRINTDVTTACNAQHIMSVCPSVTHFWALSKHIKNSVKLFTRLPPWYHKSPDNYSKVLLAKHRTRCRLLGSTSDSKDCTVNCFTNLNKTVIIDDVVNRAVQLIEAFDVLGDRNGEMWLADGWPVNQTTALASTFAFLRLVILHVAGAGSDAALVERLWIAYWNVTCRTTQTEYRPNGDMQLTKHSEIILQYNIKSRKLEKQEATCMNDVARIADRTASQQIV